MPKCQSCCKNKRKKGITQKTLKINNRKRCRSIIEKDEDPGCSALLDHVETANVTGCTLINNGHPILKKHKNFTAFVDHNTKLVYPSFQETKTGK
jgi:hypothetical protein